MPENQEVDKKILDFVEERLILNEEIFKNLNKWEEKEEHSKEILDLLDKNKPYIYDLIIKKKDIYNLLRDKKIRTYKKILVMLLNKKVIGNLSFRKGNIYHKKSHNNIASLRYIRESLKSEVHNAVDICIKRGNDTEILEFIIEKLNSYSENHLLNLIEENKKENIKDFERRSITTITSVYNDSSHSIIINVKLPKTKVIGRFARDRSILNHLVISVNFDRDRIADISLVFNSNEDKNVGISSIDYNALLVKFRNEINKELRIFDELIDKAIEYNKKEIDELEDKCFAQLGMWALLREGKKIEDMVLSWEDN